MFSVHCPTIGLLIGLSFVAAIHGATINSHPNGQTLLQGQAANLSVAASGSGPLSYQWVKDGVTLPGATNSIYPIASAAFWHAGEYAVRVTDNLGTVTSNIAPLTISGGNTGIWKSLMGYYRFNGSGVDQTPFNNFGTVFEATPALDRFGAAGASYSFDGLNDNIEVPEMPGFEGDAISVSVWINAATLSPGGRIRSNLVEKDGNSRQWVIQLEMSGKIRAAVFTNSGEKVLDSTAIISPGSWHHALFTWDKNDLKIYIDGIFDSSVPATGDMVPGSLPVIVGGSPHFNSWFQGELDEVRIYNRALSATEVAALNVYEDPDTDLDGIRDRFETGTGIYVSPTNTGTNPTLADTDGDGLNDGIEITQHGSNPNLSDTDTDGFNDGFEVALGFNPALAASTPESSAAMLPAVEFRFNGATGQNYRIEQSTDLSTWNTIENSIQGTGGTIVRFYPASGIPRKFYRAKRN